MKNNDLVRIKQKFNSLNSKAYWGDDFDVRFYLISRFTEIKNKNVLDIGGGIGIISSELDKSNFSVNFDLSYDDLIQCKNGFKNSINVMNGNMTNIALKDNSFDYVICAHMLEYAKTVDIENREVIENKISIFPTIAKILSEIRRVLKPGGTLFLTTPNDEYYNSTKLTHDELKIHFEQSFDKFSLKLYNTYPRLNSHNRKLNMANVIPKLMVKISDREKIIQKSLIEGDNKNNTYSVSCCIEATN